MTDLLELAARVEGLTGPDREVDAEIAVALRRTHSLAPWAIKFPDWRIGHSFGRARVEVWSDDEMIGQWSEFQPVTTSIDAAMTLVPEGHWPEGSLGSNIDQRSSLEIHAPCTYDPVGRAAAATPALALIAACLRARAHGGGEG